MRQDSSNFAASNSASSKAPRYVVELAFDSDNSVLRYFTSHTDAELPVGGLSVDGVVEGLAGTSQRIDPDKAIATIGSWSFELTDVTAEVTELLAGQLTLGRSTRQQRVRFYMGFEELAWDDYSLLQTQLVEDITFEDGVYKFRCADIQRAMRKEIFDVAETNLSASLTSTATTVEVYDTSDFETVAHGASYSDAPNQTVGYIQIDDEIIRYTGKTSTTFTGCTRGALNTVAAEHNVDSGATQDQRQIVTEYVYLEMPAPKLALALLTGDVYTNDSPTSSLPSSWHLGIDAAYITETDFINVGPDLWNLDDDEEGLIVRFAGEKKTDGKQFIEQQLMLLLGCFMPIYADGSIGLKRMANVLAGAAYVELLDETNVVSVGELLHDFKSLHNVIEIKWNYEPALGRCTRRTGLIDSASITTHGRAEPYKVEFRGLHGSRHSSTTLRQRFDAIRDRYTGPPLRITARVLPSRNVLEVGDVVRLNLDQVRDFVAGSSPTDYALDRSFEVQQVQIDWVTGNVVLSLFASSQAPEEQAATSDVTVLSDAWYISEGTDLASVLTITGSNPGHVSASGSLTGATDLNAAGAIFYYNGDLQIDAGVTVEISNNVQLRIKGFLQNNGTIDGIGNGIAGAAALTSPTSQTSANAGTAGFLGSTRAGGGLVVDSAVLFNPTGEYFNFTLSSREAAVVEGQNNAVPSFNIRWDGTSLLGIPTDLRGTSGSTGLPFTAPGPRYYAGGAGGAGGAGLVIVSRGFAQGAAGKINLSGGDGSVGRTVGFGGGWALHAGSGAGGAPGALLVLLDGALISATGLTQTGFVAEYGETPIAGTLPPRASGAFVSDAGSYQSYFVGTGDGSTFPVPSLSGGNGGARVQYVAANTTPSEDPSVTELQPPTSLTLDSVGEFFVNEDGATVPRILASWTASADPRTLGYELQFRTRGTDSPPTLGVWQPLPTLFGQSSTQQWVHPVRSGGMYDVRVRAVGATRQVSEWVELDGETVGGDTTVPGDVVGLSYSSPYLSWTANTDADLLGYQVRVQDSTDSPLGWDYASVAHEGGYITETEFDVTGLTAGDSVVYVKAFDRTLNESANAASSSISIPTAPDIYTIMVSNWTTRTHPRSTDLANRLLNAADYGNGVFVCVGENDGTDAYIITSPDGVTWTERTNPKNTILKCVLWTGSIFVAGGVNDGTDSYLITSSDGATWTERANPKTAGVNGLATNGSLIVGVGGADGSDAYIITSTDGVTWTERSNPKNFSLNDVCWNGSLFVAVGFPDGTDSYIITSPDGVTWTERSNPKNKRLYGVDFGSSIFVAVGEQDGAGDAYIVTSPDGVTWTEQANPRSLALYNVIYAGGIFMAIGDASGTNYAISSKDGVTWTQRGLSGTAANGMFGLGFSGSKLVACGADGSTTTRAMLMTSISVA